MPETPFPTTLVLPPKRRTPIQRIGCALALLIWFVVLLTPCFFIVMATQNEIAITLSDVPGHAFRIWLVNEADERGLAIAQPSLISSGDPNAVCLESHIRFALWMGSTSPADYCECYQRGSADAAWQFVSTQQGNCGS
jgi:hypothetical protein